MNDSLHDDVKALLDKDFGDDRILKQILRACENDEVISNFERDYVRRLAEKYLGKKPQVERASNIQPKEEEEEEKEETTVPDVIIPRLAPVQKTQVFQAPRPKTASGHQTNSKIMVGIGGAALAVIIAIAVSLGGTQNTTPDIVDPATPVDVLLSIKSDLKSYRAKDLISISGISETPGTASLSIENQDGKLIWEEQVSIKSNGSYSTLAIAGGLGWEESGSYLLIVDNGEEIKSSTFTFKAS